MALNGLDNANLIAVGQVLAIPPLSPDTTPSYRIIPDSLLVRGPGSASFDVSAFISAQPGYIDQALDRVAMRLADGSVRMDILTAADIVTRVSTEFSVDPRLLLALLEYRAGWLSGMPPEALRTHPMISEEASGEIDRAGLYRQLSWAANELNRGYYGWKYEGWNILDFDNGVRIRYAPDLNAATVGLQHMLHLYRDEILWQIDVGPDGFFQTYARLFGNPAAIDAGPVTSADGLTQPALTLPFGAGETWYFTGGPHGAWGNGSAWGAVDFAPPDDRADGVLCFTSAFWTVAVAPGVIARSGDGVVVLDLDGDGDETTGWTILYLHIAADGRVGQGMRLAAGDRIGRPACEGGFSTATHLHLARRYNGEWLPAYCHACRDSEVEPLTLSGWRVVGFRNQEYQGYMMAGGERREADQGRNNPLNQIQW